MRKTDPAMQAAYAEYSRGASGQVLWTYKVFAQYAKRHPLWLLKYATPTSAPRILTAAQIAAIDRMCIKEAQEYLDTTPTTTERNPL